MKCVLVPTQVTIVGALDHSENFSLPSLANV